MADACLRAALTTHVALEARRGKLPCMSEDDAHRDGAGMVALAMGKMGAGELNYSSDIDLICLFDDDRFDPAEVMEARAGFIRADPPYRGELGRHHGGGLCLPHRSAAQARCQRHARLHLDDGGRALL